jgi:hypothetical protein
MRERQRIYRDILRCCRQRVERARFRCDRKLAGFEAEHLALIPPLLRSTDDRCHRHYLEVDQPRFVRGCKAGAAAELEPLWAELRAMLSEPPLPATVPFASIEGPVLLGYRRI